MAKKAVEAKAGRRVRAFPQGLRGEIPPERTNRTVPFPYRFQAFGD